MKKQIKVLTIGGATQDIFLNYKDLDIISLPNNGQDKKYIFFEEGAKVDLQELSYYSGGGATNSAVAFKRLGFDVSTVIKLGRDCQGEFVLNDLKKENIDVSQVIYSNILPTATSIIFPCPSGDRVVLAYRGSNKDLDIQDLNLNIIKNYDALYITSLSDKSANIFMKLTRFAKENNILVAANPGINQLQTKEFKEALQNIDILTLNNQEAQELFNLLNTQKVYSIENYVKEISKLGTKIIAVTDGVNGVYAYQDDTIYFHESIKPEIVVNTLGAGDAFGSFFVASILNGKTIPEALFAGILNSSSVSSKEDAKSGLLSQKVLIENVKKTKIKIIETKIN